MGKQSRRKRDKDRRTEGEGPTPRQRFQMAMIEGELGEIREHGKPCVLCDAHTRNAGVWAPSAPLSRYLGAAPAAQRVIVYAICDACRAAPDHMRKVETIALQHRRERLAVEAAGLEVVDGFVPFSSPDDAGRFADAYERNAPPA